MQNIIKYSLNKTEVTKKTKAEQIKIKSLKTELRRKEKALAETAALLVLRKKLDAFWETDNEDDSLRTQNARN